MIGKIIHNDMILIPYLKSTVQANEPTLPADGSLEVWEQTTDSNRAYLLYRRQDSAIRRIELLNYTPAKGVLTQPVFCTTTNITLYVRSTGNDGNDGLTSENALLTIQAAINKIPRSTQHKIIIDVGAGSFAGFALCGYSMIGWLNQDRTDYQFTIRGADFINFTPATGLGSGTSNGGTTSTLIDSTQTWTAHDLRGKLVYVNSEWLIIRDNDATSFETIGVSGSTMSGKAYVIQECATTITSPVLYGYKSGIYISNCLGCRNTGSSIFLTKFKLVYPGDASTEGVYVERSDITISYIFTDISNCAIGINITRSHNPKIENCYDNQSQLGLQMIYCSDIRSIKNIYTYGSAVRGMSIGCSSFVNEGSGLYADYCADGILFQYTSVKPLTNIYAAYNTKAGLQFIGCMYSSLDKCVLDNNGYGLVLGCTTPQALGAQKPCSCNCWFAGDITITNSVHSGVYIGFGTNTTFTNLTGSGNKEYGIVALHGARVYITAGTTVCGDLGDVLIGESIVSYAEDFSVNKAYVTDPSEFTVVKRKDQLVW